MCHEASGIRHIEFVSFKLKRSLSLSCNDYYYYYKLVPEKYSLQHRASNPWLAASKHFSQHELIKWEGKKNVKKKVCEELFHNFPLLKWHTKIRLWLYFYCYTCICCRCYDFPSRCLATIWDTHTITNYDRGIYEVRRSHGLGRHDIQEKIHTELGSGIRRHMIVIAWTYFLILKNWN